MVDCQSPLSMGLSWQEYWSEFPCPPPGDRPDPGIKPVSPELQVDFFFFFTAEPLGKPNRKGRAEQILKVQQLFSDPLEK